MIMLGRTVLLMSLAALGCDHRADVIRDTRPAPADAPPALTLAHDAYLAGNFVELGERLRDTIVDPHAGELALDNAFALLESAYEARHGELPVRTPLPSVVSVVTFGVLNGAVPWVPHRLVFLDMRLSEGRAAHVKDIRVTKLPSEPILALADKRGTLLVTHELKGFDHVKLEARGLDVLPERGAFAIQIDFDDAPGIDTFVLANKLVASAQPEVAFPDVGQALSETRPEIVWRPYRSPEFVPWEARSLNLGIVRDSSKAQAFDVYRWEPGDLARVRVEEPLAPDGYWLDILYQELRTFGGIHVSRLANSARPFSVVR